MMGEMLVGAAIAASEHFMEPILKGPPGSLQRNPNPDSWDTEGQGGNGANVDPELVGLYELTQDERGTNDKGRPFHYTSHWKLHLFANGTFAKIIDSGLVQNGDGSKKGDSESKVEKPQVYRGSWQVHGEGKERRLYANGNEWAAYEVRPDGVMFVKTQQKTETKESKDGSLQEGMQAAANALNKLIERWRRI